MFTTEEFKEQLGSPNIKFVVDRFRKFVHISPETLSNLAESVLTEAWGQNHFVLEKYLAVQVPWSLEQGKFSSSQTQFYTTAGHLQTRYGTPVYLVFEKNNRGTPPWHLKTIGPQISAPSMPVPPDIPNPPNIKPGSEIVINDDHILGENADRVSFLKDTPPVGQMCAVSGAIQWALFRNLKIPYWYFGNMNYLIPVYLKDRDDITRMPDLIAPVQINQESLTVRTLLDPVFPYANARVAVRRHDELPHWLLDGWKEYSVKAPTEKIEDPEGEKGTIDAVG